MGFIDNILENLGLDGLGEGVKPKVLLIGFEKTHIEGVKSILSFNDKEVVLCLKSTKLKIKGENLSVDKFCDGDVVVCGKIWAIEKA